MSGHSLIKKLNQDTKKSFFMALHFIFTIMIAVAAFMELYVCLVMGFIGLATSYYFVTNIFICPSCKTNWYYYFKKMKAKTYLEPDNELELMTKCPCCGYSGNNNEGQSKK